MLYASILITIGLLPQAVEAAVACNETHNPCEVLLWKGSKCLDGFCTNPFQGGCLRAILDNEEYDGKYSSDGDANNALSMQALRRRLLSRPRVCNSEDGPDALAQGLCVESENEYPEVRIYSHNWESAFVNTWIMQVIYSELLGVPSTIESGMANKNVNFYDESNRMEYGSSNDKSVIENAHAAEGGDCTIYKGSDEYSPCAHLCMDICNNGWLGWDDLVESGAAETLKLVGMIGYQSWFVTNFSIKRDPSLANHYGLSGEENRQKLAGAFKRPTTWGAYCTLVSPNNCAVDDGVAKRAPAGGRSEDGLFFSSGFYTGHFRATEKNDCDANPTTCTGHIMDLPCGWTSYVKQQTKHIAGGIALESDGTQPSGGYTYGELVDIWSAANATKSDVIGLWWAPDPTASLFKGTSSELTPVLLPAATQSCLNNRIDLSKRCDPTATEFDVYGDSEGACGEPGITTQKIAVKDFKTNIINNNNPKAQMSPAFDVYERFVISEVEVNDILTQWIFRGVDKYGFDLRFATCNWIADNLVDITKRFVPPSHPQALVASNNSGLTITATIFSAVAILITIGAAGGIFYKHQKGKLGRATQIEFLLLLLAGLFMVSVGSLLMAVEPSTGTCVGSIWLVNVGYTTQLVPTLMRVSTIIGIIRASMKMKVVRVDKKLLFRKSIGISSIAAVYCLFWTIFDTPHPQASLEVTGDQNEFGETIVKISHHCDSDTSIWFYISFSCQAILLLCASALAYQMRQAPNSVNDSKPLAIMIYSSFFFLALRFVMHIVSETVSGDSQSMKASLQKARSLFCSLDTIANVLIFFTRFFMAKGTDKLKLAHRGSTSDVDDNPRPGGASYFANNIARRMNGATGKFAEEEKVEEKEEFEEEEGSQMPKSIIRIRVKGQSIALPEWVVEKYRSKDNADESKVVDTYDDRHSCNSGFDEETDGWKEHD